MDASANNNSSDTSKRRRAHLVNHSSSPSPILSSSLLSSSFGSTPNAINRFGLIPHSIHGEISSKLNLKDFLSLALASRSDYHRSFSFIISHPTIIILSCRPDVLHALGLPPSSS